MWWISVNTAALQGLRSEKHSPQGISMAVKRLEEELGCMLFQRSSRGVVPTENSDYLVIQAKEIIARVEACFRHFEDSRQTGQTLPIYCAPGTFNEVALPVIAKLKTQYPDLFIAITERSDLLCDAAVERQEVELALTLAPVDERKFDCEPLFSTMHSAIMHESHPLACRESISVSDLRYTPVTIIKEEIKTNPNFRRACRAAGFEPKILATVDDILLVYYFAENNIGVGISTARLAQNLNIPNVRSIPFVEPELSWKVLLIKRKNATLSKEAKILAKALLADRDARFSEIGVKGIPLSAF
jgi:DNA-binding transcriptional LysR family regulator